MFNNKHSNNENKQKGLYYLLKEHKKINIILILLFIFQERCSTSMDGRLKQISQMCLDNQKLLLGTEGGNIYHLNLTTFVIEESIIYQDLVIQHSTDEFKVNPGAVEALHLHPKDDTKILIGKKWHLKNFKTIHSNHSF